MSLSLVQISLPDLKARTPKPSTCFVEEGLADV